MRIELERLADHEQRPLLGPDGGAHAVGRAQHHAVDGRAIWPRFLPSSADATCSPASLRSARTAVERGRRALALGLRLRELLAGSRAPCRAGVCTRASAARPRVERGLAPAPARPAPPRPTRARRARSSSAARSSSVASRSPFFTCWSRLDRAIVGQPPGRRRRHLHAAAHVEAAGGLDQLHQVALRRRLDPVQLGRRLRAACNRRTPRPARRQHQHRGQHPAQPRAARELRDVQSVVLGVQGLFGHRGHSSGPCSSDARYAVQATVSSAGPRRVAHPAQLAGAVRHAVRSHSVARARPCQARALLRGLWTPSDHEQTSRVRGARGDGLPDGGAPRARRPRGHGLQPHSGARRALVRAARGRRASPTPAEAVDERRVRVLSASATTSSCAQVVLEQRRRARRPGARAACSSITRPASAMLARELHQRALARGVGFLDAPVSRRPGRRRAGHALGDGRRPRRGLRARAAADRGYARRARLLGPSGQRPAHQDGQSDLHRRRDRRPGRRPALRRAGRARPEGRGRGDLAGRGAVVADGASPRDA